MSETCVANMVQAEILNTEPNQLIVRGAQIEGCADGMCRVQQGAKSKCFASCPDDRRAKGNERSGMCGGRPECDVRWEMDELALHRLQHPASDSLGVARFRHGVHRHGQHECVLESREGLGEKFGFARPCTTTILFTRLTHKSSWMGEHAYTFHTCPPP